ncbi:unnamed protein product, partial [Cyprideis torosa]
MISQNSPKAIQLGLQAYVEMDHQEDLHRYLMGMLVNAMQSEDGGSRGIGLAIAKKLASRGYNIVIGAKTVNPQANLEGTIYTAAEELEKAGGKALPLQLDIRDEDMVKEAIEKAAAHFGGIDVVINNASAISLTSIEQTSMKRYDLMMDINVRGTFMVSKYAIPYLKNGNNPHILTLSPPVPMKNHWFTNHTAYTMSKYAMSLTVIGQSQDLASYGIASNALWPKTTIATAAVRNLLGGEEMVKVSRTPEIMADAADIILHRDSHSFSGNFVIDESILMEEGMTDFKKYR